MMSIKKISFLLLFLYLFRSLLGSKNSSEEFSKEYDDKLINNKGLTKSVELTEKLKEEVKDLLSEDKLGYWAKSIFIHNIDAVKEEYGDNVRYMTKASVDSDDDQQTPSFFSYYCHIL